MTKPLLRLALWPLTRVAELIVREADAASVSNPNPSGSTHRQQLARSVSIEAEYTYDAFGNLIDQNSLTADSNAPVSDNNPTNKVGIFVLSCFILGLGILAVKNRRNAVILLLSISLIIVPGTPYAASGIVSVNNNIKNPYGFTGERQFREADGLIFLRARYYDPSIGRFISRDPILKPMIRGGGSFWVLPNLVHLPNYLHPYVYVANNPVNWTDPSGLIPEWVGHIPWYLVKLAFKVYGIGKLITLGILTVYEGWQCARCLARAAQYVADARERMDPERFQCWLRTLPGSECAGICATSAEKAASLTWDIVTKSVRPVAPR